MLSPLLDSLGNSHALWCFHLKVLLLKAYCKSLLLSLLCPDQELCRLSSIHHRKKLHGLSIVAGMVLCELHSWLFI